MEFYFAPPTDRPEASLTRDQALAAFAAKGLRPRAVEEGGFWIVGFEESDAHVSFQQRGDLLVFATVEQSMLDDSDVPFRVQAALEEAGWECDEESFG